MIVDTHKAIELLLEASKDNKKFVEAIVKLVHEQNNDLATKSDIEMIKSDIKNIKDVMATKADISEAKYDILKTTVPIGLTILLLVVGLWFK